MIWWLYNILFVVIYILMLPHFFWRMWKRGGYRRHFLQRIALFDPATRALLSDGRPRIWIHAVSVGEFYVASRFMEALRKERPEYAFVLTTTTSTGHALARERLSAPDVLLYFPVDIPPVMRRMLKWIRPKMLVLVETEFWPNLIRLCRADQIPVVMINGRISPRSYRGYRRLKPFTRRVLPMLNAACMQSEGDRERIVSLGAAADRALVLGSSKYELHDRDDVAEARAMSALRSVGFQEGDPVMMGGSTWPGEEAVLMAIYKTLKPRIPNLRLVLVPRHVERTPSIVEEIEREGLTFVRRSQVSGTEPSAQAPDVLLVDTTGELRHFYAWMDVIFVGKSLTAQGGQNVIEPASYGKAVVVGPHMTNFDFIMADFLKADAIRQVPDADGLAAVFDALLTSSEARTALGQRAGDLVQARSGATQKTLERLLPLLP